ncbi:MAG: hypothetical protein ICV60_07995 [Pyrinomonadaceae bacterium]|nr:hypothetical protein [Pyrinomonadaceae bacterium]
MRFLKLLLILIAALSLAFMLAASVQSQGRSAQAQEGRGQGGRMRPPTGLSCDRNNTTSFTGRITAYSRNSQRIFIRVRTDEQTTEQFTIPLKRGEDASKKFLFQGEAFRAGDWKKIERARGVLRPKMRATIWACRDEADDFHAEIIDWRPNEQGGSFVTALKLIIQTNSI